MTEISVPPSGHHRNGAAAKQLAMDPEGGKPPRQSRPESTLTTTALFIQANVGLDSSSASIRQLEIETNPLEEDHTIVIDLTAEEPGQQRCYDSSSSRPWSGATNGRSNGKSSSTSASSGQRTTTAKKREGGVDAPQLRSMLSNLSSSLDVHPPTDGGEEEEEEGEGKENGGDTSQFLISRMLNGTGEEGGEERETIRKTTISNGDLNGRGGVRIERGSSSLPRLPGLQSHFIPDDNGQEEEESESEDEDDEDKNLSNSFPTEKFVDTKSGGGGGGSSSRKKRDENDVLRRPKQLNLLKSHLSKSLDPDADDGALGGGGPSAAAAEDHIRRSRSLRRDVPFSLFESTSQTLYEAPLPNDSARFHTLSSVHRLRSGEGLRSLERRPRTTNRSIKTRKSRSNDFLDRMDVSQSTSTSGKKKKSHQQRLMQQRSKMNKIETALYLGNMEAATDVILLESHEISHIVTLDSVPLPRKISSFLPRICNLHLQVTDLPDEDILSSVPTALDFINRALDKGGNVLVHCFRGKSRSAAIVIAYVMQKYKYTLEKAHKKVKQKRDCIRPHDGFLAQLKLFESMEYALDSSNVQFKMFKVYLASERMRKAKILFRDSLENVLDDDPGELGSARGDYSLVYKCKRCRRTLATSHNLIPHVKGEQPSWRDAKWSLPAEEVLEGASDLGLDLCSASVVINPIKWMEAEIKQNLSGRLYCPNCQCKVGSYSWVKGSQCGGCKATVTPSFQLDVTEIIFKTKNRYLQSSGREPVVV